MTAATDLALEQGIAPASEALGFSRAKFYRYRCPQGHESRIALRPNHPRALDAAERPVQGCGDPRRGPPSIAHRHQPGGAGHMRPGNRLGRRPAKRGERGPKAFLTAVAKVAA